MFLFQLASYPAINSYEMNWWNCREDMEVQVLERFSVSPLYAISGWQWSNSACFWAIYFLEGYARFYVMRIFVVNQHWGFNIFQNVIKIIKHFKVPVLNLYHFMHLFEETETEHTYLLFYAEKQSPMGYTSWHRMSHKTHLLVWHTQPFQWAQSAMPGEDADCAHVGRPSGYIQKQTQILGTMRKYWDFWHGSRISRKSEWDPVRTSSPFLCMTVYVIFQKSLRNTFQPQNTSDFGVNESMTHLWINQVNQFCPC